MTESEIKKAIRFHQDQISRLERELREIANKKKGILNG